MLLKRQSQYSVARRHQVTAVETIDGVAHRIVLQQDRFGIYRESSVDPLDSDVPRSPAGQRACVRTTDRGHAEVLHGASNH